MRFSHTEIIFILAILLATNGANAHQTSIKPAPVKPAPIKPTAINKNYQLTINQIADNVFQHFLIKK